MNGAQQRADRPIITYRQGAAAAVLALVLVALLAVAVVAGLRERDAAQKIAANRASVRSEAASVLAAVFSVDRTRWQSDRATARSLVTGDFAATFGAQLRRAPDAGVASVRWRAGPVAIIRVGAADAETLIPVVATTRTLPTDARAAESTDADYTVRAEFVLHEGHWLLESAEALQ